MESTLVTLAWPDCLVLPIVFAVGLGVAWIVERTE